MSKQPDRIFSGEYSHKMWTMINEAGTAEQVRNALYLVCCRLQELEAKLWPRKEGRRRDGKADSRT